MNTVAERMKSKYVVTEDGCWEWTASRKRNGYAQIGLTEPRKTMAYAHRVSFELFKGSIAAGLQIDHLCRNRGCVNPAHLEAVPQRTNLLRSPITIPSINATKTRCVRGHLLSGDNLCVDKRGWRECRTCKRERDRRQYRTKRFSVSAPRSDAA